MTTLLEASSRYLKATTHVVRVDIHPEDYREAMSAMDDEIKAARAALEQAIEREKANPQDVAEVINDLTPTRRSCANCKFKHYDKLEAPCLPCRFYSNWEPRLWP